MKRSFNFCPVLFCGLVVAIFFPGQIIAQSWDSSAPATLFTRDQGGALEVRVGIGTDVPSVPLHIYSASAPVSALIATRDVSKTASLTLKSGKGFLNMKYTGSPNGFYMTDRFSRIRFSITDYGVGIDHRDPRSTLSVGAPGDAVASTLTINSGNDAILHLNADSDAAGAQENPYIRLSQKGGSKNLYIGLTDKEDFSPMGSTYKGLLENAAFIGTLQKERLQLGVNQKVIMTLSPNGNLGIGTSTPQTKLAVNGTVTCKEVEVTLTGFPDYVFASDYPLPSLDTVAAFIREHHHLPGIPSASEVYKEGIGLGELNKRLLEKVEEITLYLIEIKAENDSLKQEMGVLKELFTAK